MSVIGIGIDSYTAWFARTASAIGSTLLMMCYPDQLHSIWWVRQGKNRKN
jgi:hypothetical protein